MWEQWEPSIWLVGLIKCPKQTEQTLGIWLYVQKEHPAKHHLGLYFEKNEHDHDAQMKVIVA